MEPEQTCGVGTKMSAVIDNPKLLMVLDRMRIEPYVNR